MIFASIAGNIAPSQNSWIQATTLIFPILFIINFLLLLYWATIANKIIFLPLMVLLIGFGNIFSNFQLTIINSDIKHNEDTKVLTYNVKNFGEQKNKGISSSTKKDIISFLINEDSDIICLQEYQSTNKKLYEPLKKIRDTINAQSYYYESYFNPKYNQLLGLVIFSKYKAVNKGKLKFNGSRAFGIYTDVLINNDTVRIFNIHLASIKLVPEDLDFVVNPDVENSDHFKNQTYEIYNKLQQAYNLREKQLNHLINEIESCPYQIILSGDFNDTPSSWVYHQITNYLSDTYVSKGRGISSTYAGPLPLLRIDYIMTSERFKTKNFTRHKFVGSDHFPISAIIQTRNHK